MPERNFKGDIFIAKEGSAVLEMHNKDAVIIENNDDGVMSSLTDEMVLHAAYRHTFQLQMS